MDKVIYAQLVSLLDIYERNKKDCGEHDDRVYYSGACDALNKLKRKVESLVCGYGYEEQKRIFTLVLEYKDESEAQVQIVTEGEPSEYKAILSMICRGTLMASSAQRCTIYNSEGSDVISYTK